MSDFIFLLYLIYWHFYVNVSLTKVHQIKRIIPWMINTNSVQKTNPDKQWHFSWQETKVSVFVSEEFSRKISYHFMCPVIGRLSHWVTRKSFCCKGADEATSPAKGCFTTTSRKSSQHILTLQLSDRNLDQLSHQIQGTVRGPNCTTHQPSPGQNLAPESKHFNLPELTNSKNWTQTVWKPLSLNR